MRITIVFFLILLFSACQSNGDRAIILEKKNKNHDKFEDSYSGFKYYNKSLGLIINFDSDWVIITKYENFNDFQKKYAEYFLSDVGEVLFIGFNDKKKIGVRCTCEELNMSNLNYLGKLKNLNANEAKDYQINYSKEIDVTLKNINAYQYVFETKINANNIFIFDCLLFRNKKYNFNLNFWTDKINYDEAGDYIHAIYNNIDFILVKDDYTGDKTNTKDDNTDDSSAH